MKIYIKDVKGLVVPVQGKPDDAAYDIIATTPPKIVGEMIERPIDGVKAWSRIRYIEYGTNVAIAPEDEVLYDFENVMDGSKEPAPVKSRTKFHTLLHPRSSVSNYNLVLANSIGLVDNGYRNEIFMRFKYIVQPEDLIMLPEAGVNRFYAIVNPENIYKEADKICQIKAMPNIPIEFVRVPELSESARGLGGFGSTGK